MIRIFKKKFRYIFYRRVALLILCTYIMSWLRGHNGIVRVASDFVLLSVVTSLALNTTMQLRSRNERNRDFVIQRQLILRVLEQLEKNRRQTLLNTSSICKQMILAGLKPSEFGFDSAEASDIESSMKSYHSDLSWYEAFFSQKSPTRQKVESHDFGDTQWEQGMVHTSAIELTYSDFLKILQELENSENSS